MVAEAATAVDHHELAATCETQVLEPIVAEDQLDRLARDLACSSDTVDADDHGAPGALAQQERLVADRAPIAIGRHAAHPVPCGLVAARDDAHRDSGCGQALREPHDQRGLAGAPYGEIADDDHGHIEAHAAQPAPRVGATTRADDAAIRPAERREQRGARPPLVPHAREPPLHLAISR